VTAHLDPELRRLRRHYPNATMSTLPDGVVLVRLGPVPVAPGWSLATATIAFVVPVGYPAAQPDCFYVEENLTLADGRAPQNSGRQSLGGRDWTWFSWHLQSWRPGRDDLFTYARFVELRMSDAR
jgi:Prokaryotic E2 family E